MKTDAILSKIKEMIRECDNEFQESELGSWSAHRCICQSVVLIHLSGWIKAQDALEEALKDEAELVKKFEK